MKRLLLAALVLMATSASAEWVKVTDTGRHAAAYEDGSVKPLGRGWFSGTYALSDRQNDRLYVCNARFTREAYIDDKCVSKTGNEFTSDKKEIIPNSILDVVVQAMIQSVSY